MPDPRVRSQRPRARRIVGAAPMATHAQSIASGARPRTLSQFRLIAGACAVLLLAVYAGSRTSLWDRDEPRFAQATVEMLSSRDWLVPTFDHELRLDKPAGIYWLMSLPLRVLGAHAVSARLVSAFALALAAWSTAQVARRLHGERTALWSLLVLGTCPLAFAEGTLATTDASLLACSTFAMALTLRVSERKATLVDTAALAAVVGAAQLLKGPVGLLLPALAIAATIVAFVDRSRRARAFAWLAAGALGGVLLFLAWALPANAATGGEFLRRGLGHHVLERTTTPLEGHGHGFWRDLPYYVPVVACGMLPWSALAPACWGALARSPRTWSRSTRFLLAWSLPCLAVMTLVATKLPHYVLPSFPALAIAIARAIDGSPSPRTQRICAVLACASLATLAAGVIVGPRLAGLADASNAAVPAAIVLAISTAVATVALWRSAWSAGVRALLAGQVAFLAFTAFALLPALERTKISPPLAAAIRAKVPADVPIARYGYVEPSVDFLLDRAPIRELLDDTELHAWLAEAGRGVLIVPRDRLAHAGVERLPERVRERAVITGYHWAKGREASVLALERH